MRFIRKRRKMQNYQLTAPCHFGLEAICKREIYDLGYEITKVEDGRVTFAADAEGICRANIFLRTAERVLLEVGRFRATTFDELFEGIKALPWENYIPKDGKLKKIALFLDTSVDYLRYGDQAPQYYLNDETAKMAQEIFDNKELRMLFDAARDAAPEDLEAAHTMILALKRKERRNIDD